MADRQGDRAGVNQACAAEGYGFTVEDALAAGNSAVPSVTNAVAEARPIG